MVKGGSFGGGQKACSPPPGPIQIMTLIITPEIANLKTERFPITASTRVIGNEDVGLGFVEIHRVQTVDNAVRQHHRIDMLQRFSSPHILKKGSSKRRNLSGGVGGRDERIGKSGSLLIACVRQHRHA
jgi:hypothetical protein